MEKILFSCRPYFYICSIFLAKQKRDRKLWKRDRVSENGTGYRRGYPTRIFEGRGYSSLQVIVLQTIASSTWIFTPNYIGPAH